MRFRGRVLRVSSRRHGTWPASPTMPCASDRLQAIFAQSRRCADDDGNGAADELADVVPDDRVRHVEVEQVRGTAERRRRSWRGVPCRGGGPPPGLDRDRRRDVEEISVAVGAGTEHCVGEDDGVRFGPGDVLTDPGPSVHLIGSACPGRLAPHCFVGVHQCPRLVPRWSSPGRAPGGAGRAS